MPVGITFPISGGEGCPRAHDWQVIRENAHQTVRLGEDGFQLN